MQDMAVSMSTALATMSGLDGAAIGMKGSIQSLKDAIGENGTSLDINTAAESLRKAQIDSGLSAAYADEQYLQNVQSLRAVMLAAGMNTAQVDIMIGKYLNVPGMIKTNVELAGAIDAISKGQTLAETLRNLDGKVARSEVITTYMTVRQEQLNPSVGLGQSRGMPLIPQRYGGIHAAEGLISHAGIYAGRGAGTVVMAERETGHEAFIPQLGISQSRAMSLASEVGDWHQFDVVPRQANGYAQFANTRPMAGGGSTYAPQINLTVNAGMGVDGRQLGQQILNEIKPIILSRGGNVQQAIVGRQVP
jgi:hypothetical protein